MYRVKPEPMPGNPAAQNVGDKSGLWKVVIYESVGGRLEFRGIEARNISYMEAFQMAGRLEHQFNQNKA